MGEEAAEWMKGVGSMNWNWEGGWQRRDVVVALVTQLGISMRGLAQQMNGHLRLFHCRAVTGVARHLRLSSLGLKRKMSLKEKQAVRTDKDKAKARTGRLWLFMSFYFLVD